MNSQDVLICARCNALLSPGSGDFWEVRIDAMADPWPPQFSEADLERHRGRDWRELVRQLQDVSPREAMDQVYRRTVMYLCNACFGPWYEHPAG